MLHPLGDPLSVPPHATSRGLTVWLAVLIASAGLVACSGADSPGAMAGLADGSMSSGGSGGNFGQGGSGGKTSSDAAPPQQDGAGQAGDSRTADVLTPAPDAGAGGSGGQPAGNDGGSSDAGSCTVQPSTHEAWLTEYQMQLIGWLSGKTAYEPGKNLPNRGTSVTRQTAQQLLLTAMKDLGLAAQLHSYGTGANVFALLPSTTGNPEQVVLGAHYDTVTNSPGANDNGSGVAAVLAAARAVMQLPCRNRGLLVVLFDEEEKGFIGSAAFANKLAADVDKAPVHSVHSVDQLGWDADKDRLIELERGEPALRLLYEDAVKSLGIAVPLSATNTGSTDHVSFRPRFRAIGVTEEYRGGDTTPHRDSAGDTYDTLDFPYLATASSVVIRVMENLMR